MGEIKNLDHNWIRMGCVSVCSRLCYSRSGCTQCVCVSGPFGVVQGPASLVRSVDRHRCSWV